MFAHTVKPLSHKTLNTDTHLRLTGFFGNLRAPNDLLRSPERSPKMSANVMALKGKTCLCSVSEAKLSCVAELMEFRAPKSRNFSILVRYPFGERTNPIIPRVWSQPAIDDNRTQAFVPYFFRSLPSSFPRYLQTFLHSAPISHWRFSLYSIQNYIIIFRALHPETTYYKTLLSLRTDGSEVGALLWAAYTCSNIQFNLKPICSTPAALFSGTLSICQ